MSTPLWAIVLAAGQGRRVAGDTPKQYRMLGDRVVLEHSLAHFLALPGIAGVMVVLAADDRRFATLPCAADPRIRRVCGGDERALSSLAGVRAVVDHPDGGHDSMVLVHDAARPLLSQRDLLALLQARSVFTDTLRGALLARPLGDTLKRGGASECLDSGAESAALLGGVSRQGLWLAETPQLFIAGELAFALESALAEEQAQAITDEASAYERLGTGVRLIEARDPNFKITRNADLQLAEALLAFRGESP